MPHPIQTRWCYHCKKEIQSPYFDGHLWTKHQTTINEDVNIEAVKKEAWGEAKQNALVSFIQGAVMGYTGFTVLFKPQRLWGTMTKIIFVSVGYYGARKALGVYDMFKSKEEKKRRK